VVKYKIRLKIEEDNPCLDISKMIEEGFWIAQALKLCLEMSIPTKMEKL